MGGWRLGGGRRVAGGRRRGAGRGPDGDRCQPPKPPEPQTPVPLQDEHGDPTKIALGMYSGEGEYVEFAGDCSCDGPVEAWLMNVVESMKQALVMEFRDAIPTYDEMPRTQWLYK